jgi:hypothetical protein
VRTLPKFLDLKPVKVDYRVSGGADGWKLRDKEVKPPAPPANQLGADWHSFFDPRGREYHHNFSTGEYGRHPTKGTPPGQKRPSKEAEMYLKTIAEARGGRKLKNFSLLDREGKFKSKRKPKMMGFDPEASPGRKGAGGSVSGSKGYPN